MILKQLAPPRPDLVATFLPPTAYLIGRISIEFTKSPGESFLGYGHLIIYRVAVTRATALRAAAQRGDMHGDEVRAPSRPLQ